MGYLLASASHPSGLESFLASAGYGAVFLLSFVSSMGLPVGAELALIFGGVLASSAGASANGVKPLSLALVIVAGMLGEVLGSLAGYGIGRYGGRPLVDNSASTCCLPTRTSTGPTPGSPAGVSPSCSSGGSSRCCVPSCPSRPAWARCRSPSSPSSPQPRAPSGVTAICSLGYSLGDSYNHVLKAFSYAGYVIAAVAVVAVALVFWHRLREYRKERDAQQTETGS